MDPQIDDLIHLAQSAGRHAVAKLGSFVAELKADASFVTEVDREVEAMLRDALTASYPAAGFWGEETGVERTDARDVWVVDPIDGTTNMVHGLPIWGVSIGLLRDARPHIGVFHLPRIGETYWAVAGEGAYCNGHRLTAATRTELTREDCVAFSTELFGFLDFTRFPGKVRNLGTAATHCAYTASGALCAFLTRDDKLHDLAAGFCIAEEAGCRVEYLTGSSRALGPQPRVSTRGKGAGTLVDLRPWLAGVVNTRTVVVAPPGVLPLIRATFLSEQP
jgi:myo-inositol-1(or 4)-monophosphatase